jgi:hypothetical protein
MQRFDDATRVTSIYRQVLHVLRVLQISLYDLSACADVVTVVAEEEAIRSGEEPRVAIGLTPHHYSMHGIQRVQLPVATNHVEMT